MKYFLVHKCTFGSCCSSYIGETCRHFKTRIEEHIKKDNKSHIFKHLHSTATCFDSYSSLCFKISDKANSKFHLKIREALHNSWRKRNFNAQQITWLSPFGHSFCPPCSSLSLFVFLLLFFVFLFDILFSLSLRYYGHLLLS